MSKLDRISGETDREYSERMDAIQSPSDASLPGRDWIHIMTRCGLNRAAVEITRWRISKGFETPDAPNSDMLGKLMLVVTEVAEAAEACRDEDWNNFEEEIADIFIRLMDICGTIGIDIEGAIAEKMIKNEDRPHKHGRKSAV